MPHFKKQMETSQGLKNFYFNRIYTIDGTKYHISVRGSAHNATHYFMMSERNGGWFISQDTADWVMDVERELEAAINDHLRNG
jgi:hypothetical protein